jgi:hypothetical protein
MQSHPTTMARPLIDPDIKTIRGQCSPLPEPADATNSGTRSPGQVVRPPCPSLRDRFPYRRCPTPPPVMHMCFRDRAPQQARRASVHVAQAVGAAALLVLAARAAPARTGTWRWPAEHGRLGLQVRIGP